MNVSGWKVGGSSVGRYLLADVLLLGNKYLSMYFTHLVGRNLWVIILVDTFRQMREMREEHAWWHVDNDRRMPTMCSSAPCSDSALNYEISSIDVMKLNGRQVCKLCWQLGIIGIAQIGDNLNGRTIYLLKLFRDTRPRPITFRVVLRPGSRSEPLKYRIKSVSVAATAKFRSCDCNCMVLSQVAWKTQNMFVNNIYSIIISISFVLIGTSTDT
jgi:hypothetical protein